MVRAKLVLFLSFCSIGKTQSAFGRFLCSRLIPSSIPNHTPVINRAELLDPTNKGGHPRAKLIEIRQIAAYCKVYIILYSCNFVFELHRLKCNEGLFCVFGLHTTRRITQSLTPSFPILSSLRNINLSKAKRHF